MSVSSLEVDCLLANIRGSRVMAFFISFVLTWFLFSHQVCYDGQMKIRFDVIL